MPTDRLNRYLSRAAGGSRRTADAMIRQGGGAVDRRPARGPGGLLLFTNGGDLAYKLTHPKFGVDKTYIAKVMGVPTPGKLGVLRKGLPIDGEMTNPAKVTFLETREGKTWVSIRIAEGRHHQVRKMFEAIGHRVMKLRRVAIGPQELSNVEPGDWRYLTGKEVRDLFAYAEQKEREAAQSPKIRKVVSAPPPQERKRPRQPKPEWKKPPRYPRPAGPGRAGAAPGTA